MSTYYHSAEEGPGIPGEVGGGRGTMAADRAGGAPAPEDGRESRPAIPGWRRRPAGLTRPAPLTGDAITPDERAQFRKIADRKKILKLDGDDGLGRRTAGVFGPPLPQELQT